MINLKKKSFITEEQKKEAKCWFKLAKMFEVYKPEPMEPGVTLEDKILEGKAHGAKALGFKSYEEFKEFKEFINSLD